MSPGRGTRLTWACITATAVALLSGCSALTPTREPPAYQADATSGHFEGRLAVRINDDPKRSFSANFVLEGNARSGQLNLSTPLGTQLAHARWLPGRVWLMNSDGTQEFEAMDQLARETLGEDIPLVAFFDWLAGRAWPEAASTPLSNPGAGFRQMGWEVRLDRYADGLVIAQRQTPSSVTVRAKLDAKPMPAQP